MVAIDTNVLVRLLTADDPGQYQRSLAVFRDEPVIHIPETVALEAEWVLRAAYALDPVMICRTFRWLFGLPNVVLAHPQRMARAIAWHESGLDFSDALHLSCSQHCSTMKSFDRTLIARSADFGECRVVSP
ncbi:MAG: type II toxin-antitoxin system VapC family toxin [Pseudohongiellaceae bacterium]